MKYLFFFFLFGSLLFWSCREEESFPSASELSFSTDTLLFDTVFTSVGSVTKRLKVYNEEKKSVSIDQISLEGGNSSFFNLTVNGVGGTDFSETLLFDGDSLLVLVDVNIDPMDEDLPFIVTDKIMFSSGPMSWEVQLVAWGQDAYFFNDDIIDCNSVWTADRPYVIYNSVLVDTLCTLTIEPGAKIYSHFGSAFFVKGTLDAQGTPDNKILFSNDRLDEEFENASGQWEGIYFLEGSVNNQISYVDIRNGVKGIRMGTPDDDADPELTLSQVRIENMSEYGILAFTSDLYAQNLLVNNCRLGAVVNVAGGNYEYVHCTFANFPLDFLFDGPVAVFSNNVLLANEELLEADLSVSVRNSIIWGLDQNEIELSETSGASMLVDIDYSILKTNVLSFGANVIFSDPLIEDPALYNFNLLEDSPALGVGADLGIAIDLDGNARSAPPDLGAIERD